MYELTPEEQTMLLNFVEGNNTEAVGTNVIGKMAALNERLTNMLLERCRRLEKTNARLNARLEKIEATRERRYVEGDFEESGISAELLLKATYFILSVYAQEFKVYGACSIERAVLTMFEVYANWLEKYKTRICVDHPVAQEKGPWWWGAVKSIKGGPSTYKDAYDILVKMNPDLVAVIKNTVRRYICTSEDDFRKFICKCPAWREATKEHNNGKWNKVLDDGKIYLWRKDVLASRR